MAERHSLRDPCGWIWLLSLEMLSMVADTPSGCCEPGSQTTLTCTTSLSRLLPARGSHGVICQVQGGTGSKGGIRVFNMCLGSSLWGSNLQKYGESKLWSYFLLHSPLVDDLEGILHLCTKELGSLQEIPLHYTSSVQMHNIQSSICQEEGP